MSDALNFDLELREQPVTIAGEDYVLVELDGTLRDKYLTKLGNTVRISANGEQRVKNFDGVQASLVASSLFKINGSVRAPVSVETIQSWPSRTITGLFDAARELSALGKEAGEEEAGKD